MRLEVDLPVILHDVEASGGESAGMLRSVEPVPASPAPLDLAAAPHRIIVPFIGGLGDAVSLLPILQAIRSTLPRSIIDVVSTPGPSEVFAMSPVVDDIRVYPLTVEDWASYDAYLTLEQVYATNQTPGRSLVETFGSAFGIEPHGAPRLELPTAVPPRGVDDPPLIGVVVGDGDSHRNTPHRTTLEVLRGLVSQGYACVLLGHDDGSRVFPVSPPTITDLRSQTTAIIELATWVKAMDAVVTHDSFIMHLAGALDVPTVAAFAPTSAAHATPYGSVRTCSSGLDCAPCHSTGGTCPQGHDRCLAWDDRAVSAEVIVESVANAIGGHGSERRAAVL